MSAWTEVDSAAAFLRFRENLPLTLAQAADVLGLLVSKGARRGQPSREQVLNLIARGALRVVDAEMPSHRWTISPAELRRYMGGVAA